uniref:Variable lymphocyte receptor A n=1 Tax=Eptatretus stoutii TaxID=7765 RepID=Q32QU7_EPTST|nr:variable lymphocyte receptor A [Eptatretus stoutii]
MMGPVLAACLLIILSTAWISQANGATCKKDGGVCTCNDNTKSVDCSGKMLTAIPSNIPTDTDRLVLQGNKLSSLPRTAFHGLNKLTNLNLWGNQLQTLPPGVFDHLVALDRLHLNNNQLTSLPPGIFDQLTKLTRLDLDRNQLKSLPDGVFDKLTKLTDLTLSENKLQSLPHGVFDKLTELKTLSLRNNQLRSVPNGAFDYLSNIKTLWLDPNPWDCSCNDILYMAKWLKKKQDEGLGGVDTAGCEEGGKAVLDVTEEEAAEDCVYPNTTTAIPTTIITTLASSNDDDIPELPVPQENFQKFLGYQEPDHLPTQPQCLMSISGYLGLMMSLVLTSAAILYVIHFLKKA